MVCKRICHDGKKTNIQGGKGRDKNSKSPAKGNFLLAATLGNNYMALSSWIVHHINSKESHQDESHIQNTLTPVQNTSHWFTNLSHSQVKCQKPTTCLSMNNNTCFGTYLYSGGTHHRNWFRDWAGWPILFCRFTWNGKLHKFAKFNAVKK